MTRYENLLKEADLKGINVYEYDLCTDKECGYCIGNDIVINNRATDKQKYCVLAEELGHYKLTVGNITDLKDVRNLKQELKARRWGYEKLIGIIDLISAFEKSITGRYDLAEYFGVTEEILDETITHYRLKYGTYYKFEHYLIIFEPNLQIVKWF